MPTHPSESRLQDRDVVRIYLPNANCKAPLRTGLMLARGMGRRLFAYTFEAPGKHLPPELRRVLYGPEDSSLSERAVSHLVDTAQFGQHTPVLPPPDLDDLPASALTIVGWERGGPLPAVADVAALTARGEPLLLLSERADCGVGRALLVTAAGRNARVHGPMASLTGAVERYYGVRRRQAPDLRALRGTLSAAHDQTITFVAVDESLGHGWLQDLEALDALPGTAAVLAQGEAAVALARVLLQPPPAAPAAPPVPSESEEAAAP